MQNYIDPKKDSHVSCCSVGSGIPISIYDQHRILASGRESCVPHTKVVVRVITAEYGHVDSQTDILASFDWDG